MGYGGGGGGGGGSGGGGSGSGGSGGSGASGGSGYRRVGDDRTANLKVDNITSRDGSRGTEVDGIVEVNTTAHFIPPSGTTAERGSRGRGIFGGGYSNSPFGFTNIIDYITIPTAGNARDFGDLAAARQDTHGLSSSTRGIFAGGTPGVEDRIQYVTISSTGNAFDFGDLLRPEGNTVYHGTCADSTRGIIGGGYNPSPGFSTKAIDYITIAHLGNASSFGNLSVARDRASCFASPTRGIFYGGRTHPTNINSIEYITISTLGDGQDFGDATITNMFTAGCSSSTRGLVGGGYTPTVQNVIEYITIASTGNAIDFGDLTVARLGSSSTSNSIRGVWRAGETPTMQNVIDYVTIASTGNAADFGDATTARSVSGAFSDSHGGLG